MHVNDLLKIAVDSGASDLHLKVGSYPMMRVRGALVAGHRGQAARPRGHRRHGARRHVDRRSGRSSRTRRKSTSPTASPGLGRFRCNVFQQRGTVGLVLRVIPMQILTIDELGLPPVLKKIAEEERGLVLVHRHDRQRQEHDAGGDDRLHQHARAPRTS